MPGEWVWKNGAKQFNYAGNFGQRGVYNKANKPPGLYEAAEWTDLDGNFWLYGGWTGNSISNTLWKYGVKYNQWAWINGKSNSADPVFGIAGVAHPKNTPGVRTMSCTWTDKEGNLWLYGGAGAYKEGGSLYNDLWKYNISSNMWTWMKGGPAIDYLGSYGKKGVESPTNTPPCFQEMGVTWIDNEGDLWMLGEYHCLWKYRIQTNNWIWINGNYDVNSKAVYGVKGEASILNTPADEGYFNYTRWKDSQGSFWYLQTKPAYAYKLGILWKYEIWNNSWTWIDGDTIAQNNHNYGEKCKQSKLTQPIGKGECRTCWIDECDNLWLMGGFYIDVDGAKTLNDLIYFDTHNLNWVWVSNDTIQVPMSNYGILNVSSATNLPSSRSGAVPFKDNFGNLWLYGGIASDFGSILGDLWMYTPDTNCTKCQKKKVIEETGNLNNEFNVFPNPSLGKFNFSGLDKESVVEIYDVRGRLILEAQTTNETLAIDLTGNATGMYFYKAIDKNFEIHRGKIILQ